MTIIIKSKLATDMNKVKMEYATEKAVDEYVHTDVINIVWKKTDYMWNLAFKTTREAIDKVIDNVL